MKGKALSYHVDKAIQKAPIWCSTYLSCYSNKDHFVPLPNNDFLRYIRVNEGFLSFIFMRLNENGKQ